MTTTALSIENQWDFSGLAFLMKDLVISGSLFIGGNALSSTELGFVDGVTAGTAAASKALVLDSGKGIATITSATITTLTSTTVNATTVAATTHTGNHRFTVGADVPAAGSVIGDAAALSEGFQTVSGANGTKGVILPVAVAGMMVIIKGTTSGILKVWPQTGSAINAVGASTAMSLASGLIPAIFIASTTTQWYTIPLLPS